MMQMIAHRGPDCQDVKTTKGGLFGHCFLATEDRGPELGRLQEADNLLVSADCRIDNREALIGILRISPDAGDSEILIAGYRRWGKALASYLLGDFAFLIWDSKARQLYGARDHFGVKPLYYACNSLFFVFCSELSGVFASGLVERKVSEAAIADFLMGTAPSKESTSYADIWRLPAGHQCLLSEKDFEVEAYWTLAVPEISHRKDAPQEFRYLLTQAVAARLRGGPVGSLLSGGLDSSSIACLAKNLLQQSNEPLFPTFSMVFDATPELNERPYIEAVLEQGGFAPCFIPSDDVPPFEALNTLLTEQQDLFNAPNLACSRRTYFAARAKGVRVLLDGHGGDEVAPMGTGRLFQLASAGHWLTLWQQLGPGVLPPGQGKLALYWVFLKNFTRLRRLRRFPFARRLFPSPEEDPSLSYLNASFSARTLLVERLHAQNQRKPQSALNETSLHYETLIDTRQSYAFEILDRSAARAGIEARYPFWDKRLVEFCLSLDPIEKLNHGWNRLILRQGLEGILPSKVQWRTDKFNFMWHLSTAMLRNHAKMIEDILDDQRGVLADYVDLPKVRAAYSKLSANPGQPDSLLVQFISRLVILESWLRQQHSTVQW